MRPPELIATARRLVGPVSRGRPRGTDLRRAASTAYYAVFHAACRLVADAFVGTTAPRNTLRAWRQAYRALDHGFAKSQCANRNTLNRFPIEIQNFASTFVDLQALRHDADYDPTISFSRNGVIAEIDRAEAAIRDLGRCSAGDRAAFAVWITLKARRDA